MNQDQIDSLETAMHENQTETLNRVLAVATGIGGPGKTRTACEIADYLRRIKRLCALIDAEAENKGGGMLSTYFPEAVRIDINAMTQLDAVFRAALKSRLCLVDIGAGSGHITLPWMRRALPWFKETNTAVTLIIPVTSHLQTISSAIEWANAIGDEVDYLLVRNEVHGTDFRALDQSPAGIQLAELYHPRSIRIGLMRSDLLIELERQKLSIGQALALRKAPNAEERLGPVLNDPVSMMYLSEYHERMMMELATVDDLLRP